MNLRRNLSEYDLTRSWVPAIGMRREYPRRQQKTLLGGDAHTLRRLNDDLPGAVQMATQLQTMGPGEFGKKSIITPEPNVCIWHLIFSITEAGGLGHHTLDCVGEWLHWIAVLPLIGQNETYIPPLVHACHQKVHARQGYLPATTRPDSSALRSCRRLSGYKRDPFPSYEECLRRVLRQRRASPAN